MKLKKIIKNIGTATKTAAKFIKNKTGAAVKKGVDDEIKKVKLAAKSLNPPEPQDILKAAENIIESMPDFLYQKYKPFKKVNAKKNRFKEKKQ